MDSIKRNEKRKQQAHHLKNLIKSAHLLQMQNLSFRQKTEGDNGSEFSDSDFEGENGEEKKPERVAKWKLSSSNRQN